MAEDYTGGCACGALRYRISDLPVAQSHCQCLDCRRISGTGHGSYLTFPDRERAHVEGPAAHWAITADNGNIKTRGFCARCGTPVYVMFSKAPRLFIVHAGSLDDPARYDPGKVMYGVRGLAWDHMDPGLPVFDRMPPGAAPDTGQGGP